MSKLVLATPIIRGKSDEAVNYEAGEVIEAGIAVKRANDGTIKKFDGGGAVFGVSGYVETAGRQTVFHRALGLPVRIAEGATVNVGDKVYVDGNGLFTNVATDNAATRAIFASNVSTAADALTNEEIANIAVIDFSGGL